jgi:hypothetical protein
VKTFLNSEEFHRYFQTKPGGRYVCCRGKILNKDQNVVLDIGDIQKADALSSKENLLIEEKLVLLEIMAKVE